MYRVVNWDINNEVWGKAETLEEAKEIQGDNYFFMTGIEKFENGIWVSVKGIHEEAWEALANF
ncbi:hypothetical protein ACU1JV_00905 [Paenibacillus sp. T2-29]|uniref:hypothetical protein n=1 Tax=Paenibacillus TaxID=44249 RepID=UPI0039BD5682